MQYLVWISISKLIYLAIYFLSIVISLTVSLGMKMYCTCIPVQLYTFASNDQLPEHASISYYVRSFILIVFPCVQFRSNSFYAFFNISWASVTLSSTFSKIFLFRPPIHFCNFSSFNCNLIVSTWWVRIMHCELNQEIVF